MDQIGIFYRSAYEERRPHLIKRMDELLKVAEKLEGSLRRKLPYFGESLHICCATEKLDTAVASYFYDIHRYKHFHGMLDGGKESRINFAKVYSFTAKWISKERPFHLELDKHCEEKMLKEYLIYANNINELIILSWIKASFYALIKKELALTNREAQKIIYSLKYRDISTSFFELFLLTKFPVKEEDKKSLLLHD